MVSCYSNTRPFFVVVVDVVKYVYLDVVDGRGLGESELGRVVLACHVNVEDGHCSLVLIL